MANTYRRRDLDNDDDILRDGEVLHVPLYLKDGQPNPDLSPLQRDVGEHAVRNAARRAQVTDGAGNAGLALRRPGYRIADGIQRDMSVYAVYDAAAEVAYKNVGAGERETLGQRVCDVCRFGPEGARGHLKMINGELTCVADQQEDAASFKDDRAAAYAAKDEYYRTAYRGDGQ